MDIVRKIIDCQTVAEICALENLYGLNEYEQSLVYKRKTEIITRLVEWGLENEQINGKPYGFVDTRTAIRVFNRLE